MAGVRALTGARKQAEGWDIRDSGHRAPVSDSGQRQLPGDAVVDSTEGRLGHHHADAGVQEVGISCIFSFSFQDTNPEVYLKTVGSHHRPKALEEMAEIRTLGLESKGFPLTSDLFFFPAGQNTLNPKP